MRFRAGLTALVLSAMGILLVPDGVAAQAGTSQDGDTLVVSLQECLDIAHERSPALGEARERLYTSEGGYGIARANLLPQLNMSVGTDVFSREQAVSSVLVNETVTIPVNAGTSQAEIGGEPLTASLPVTRSRADAFSDRRYSGGVQLRQSLYNGGANWKQLGAARHRRSAARYGLEDERLGITLDVTVAYLELLRAQHLLRVSEEALDESRHRQERVEALYAVGSVARADVLQNRVQLAEDQLAHIQARNAVEQRQAELLSTMGLSVFRPIEVTDVPIEVDPSIPADYSALLAEAETGNRGLADLAEQVEASEADLGVARAGQYPAINFSWSYGWSNYRLTTEQWGDNADWTATLSLNLSLFDGLETRSRISQARHSMRQSEFQYEQQKLALALEVKQQHSSLLEALERTRVAEESVASAEERLRLEEERYRLGAATLLELIEAQVALTRARTGVVEAQYDFALAHARINRALGRD